MLELQTATLENAADFAEHWDEIEALRRRVGAEDDVLLKPLHFLTATDDTRRSCSVACWRRGKLVGLMYATEHYVRGLASGYAIGGDYSGRGLLLCASADEKTVLEHCINQAVADGVHSLHIRLLPRDKAKISIKGLKMVTLDAVIPGDRMALKASFEDFLSGLGKHTRRNIRAFMRKTEELGMEFVPSLTPDEYQTGVERLNAETAFPAEALRLARDERLLELHGGGLRAGLRSADGALVAVVCGFRLGDRFHLLTQLNDFKYERLSLSLVLRGYVIKGLIEGGVSELQFMGGSSLSLGRYCEPEPYRSIFIDRRNGTAAALKLIGSKMVSLLSRLGRPIPEQLATLCSGYLEERRLSERTALRPAAVLLEGRQHS